MVLGDRHVGVIEEVNRLVHRRRFEKVRGLYGSEVRLEDRRKDTGDRRGNYFLFLWLEGYQIGAGHRHRLLPITADLDVIRTLRGNVRESPLLGEFGFIFIRDKMGGAHLNEISGIPLSPPTLNKGIQRFAVSQIGPQQT